MATKHEVWSPNAGVPDTPPQQGAGHATLSPLARAQVRQIEPDQPEADLVAALQGAQTIIPYAGGANALTPNLVKQLPDLKVVQLMSAGFNHIDVNGVSAAAPVAYSEPQRRGCTAR